jgi:hypothetical protein
MYFKDMLNKYKDGNATEEETSLIEAELNKHEAIEEYLSERYDIDFDKGISQENIVKETNLVKNKVNRKLRRVIISSVAIVFLILFSIFYIISPLINNLYYNPSQKTIGKAQEDLFHDLKVLTELNLPGFGITGVGSSEKLGFGSYNIYFERMNFFNGEKKDVYAKIKRNARIGSFIDFIGHDNFALNIIRIPEMDKGNYLEEQRGKVISHIRKLNEVSYISSYITFKNDLTMKEFDELSKKYKEKIYFQWVGVRAEDKGSLPLTCLDLTLILIMAEKAMMFLMRANTHVYI